MCNNNNNNISNANYTTTNSTSSSNTYDEIVQKIFSNLEEHWEITQTIKELEGLQESNNIALK